MSFNIFSKMQTRYFHVFPRISTYFKRKSGAFTLMELLIYSGILVISAGIISGIFYTVSKSSLKTQAENDINNQMTQLEEIFRQKIESAQSIQTLSGSLLILNMPNNSTSSFSLINNTLYLDEGGGHLALNDSNKIKVTSLLFSPVAGLSGVSIGNHYAWSENIGWLDFAYPGGNVSVPRGAGDLNGAAYQLNNGSWLILNCAYANCCATSNFKVSSDDNGVLSGWAWSEYFGWLSFSCTTGGPHGENICCSQPSPPSPCSDYGVKVATTTTSNYQAGEWDGYAWSDQIGWISFNCKTGGNNQSNVCCSQASPPVPCSDYKVLDLRSAKTGIKIDLTLEYNSNHPEQQISRTNSFVFNILTPSK